MTRCLLYGFQLRDATLTDETTATRAAAAVSTFFGCPLGSIAGLADDARENVVECQCTIAGGANLETVRFENRIGTPALLIEPVFIGVNYRRARRKRTRIVQLHRNAQRLLRPLAVVNNHVEEEEDFPDHLTRTRRDHMKLLTLIDAIAVLHQYQRVIKTDTRVRDMIALILEDRRDDGLRGVPPEAERETITVHVSDIRAA